MTKVRNYFQEVAAAQASGDMIALVALANELAVKVSEQDARRVQQSEKKRRQRVMSPDVPGQAGTSGGSPGQAGTSRDTQVDARARDVNDNVLRNNVNDNVVRNNYETACAVPETSPAHPEKPLLELVSEESPVRGKEGNSQGNWVVPVQAKWAKCVGEIPHARVGRELKPAYEKHGVDKLCEMIWLYSAMKKARKQPMNIKWFANESSYWAEHEIPAVDYTTGEPNATLELLSRP